MSTTHTHEHSIFFYLFTYLQGIQNLIFLLLKHKNKLYIDFKKGQSTKSHNIQDVYSSKIQFVAG